MKICVLGCGLRTPLLLHGLFDSPLEITEIALYDCEPARAHLMQELGAQLAASIDKGTSRVRVSSVPVIEKAIENAAFVISSIRVGGMATRALDERIALACGFAGQETTGPAGFAMALRTIPIALEQARAVERIAPDAWIVNFTNPAGIITQAILAHTNTKAIGICDTPAELFHQIARALDEEPDNVVCDYAGLNHLGWVRGVRVRGEDVTSRLLNDDGLLRHLYPAELFAPELIRGLRAIPTEYLFYYYNQTLARDNQGRAGVTRGEELKTLNVRVEEDLNGYVQAGDTRGALDAYKRYLNRRNASYMKLDGAAHSAFDEPEPDWNPFEGATGYHRIAVSAITALISAEPHTLVLNVRNQGAIEGLRPDDVVEVPCLVDRSGARPLATGIPPESVRGLVLSVKQYERLTVRAAVEGRWDLAALALTTNPIVGSWDAARQFLERLVSTDKKHFSHFEQRDILRSVNG